MKIEDLDDVRIALNTIRNRAMEIENKSLSYPEEFRLRLEVQIVQLRVVLDSISRILQEAKKELVQKEVLQRMGEDVTP